MFVVVHAAAGAAIFAVVKEPLVSVPLAFVGHFILDKIPHWTDEKTRKEWGNKVFSLVAFDFFLFAIFIYWLINRSLGIYFFYGVLPAVIIDIDAMFYHEKFIDIFKTPLPKWLSKIHYKSQNEVGIVYGTLTQIVVFLVSVLVILKYA